MSNTVNLIEGWEDYPYLEYIPELYEKMYEDGKKMAPKNMSDIFKPFRLCSSQEVKVVIIGQDPYPEYGLADGLAFSMADKDCVYDNAMKHIKGELIRCYGTKVSLNSNSLKRWAEEEHVLLLNSFFTLDTEQKKTSYSMEWHC